MQIDSYNFLPLERTLNLHNVIMLIKLVFNQDKNNYYNTYLEKGYCQLP